MFVEVTAEISCHNHFSPSLLCVCESVCIIYAKQNCEVSFQITVFIVNSE